MHLANIFTIIIAAVFVNNFVLMRFLGLCPFVGVSKKIETSVGMGFAVMFCMTLAGIVTWLCNKYILVRFNIEYLQTIMFILVIASLVQFVELFMKKFLPALYQALGIFLPLITTNCAVLGVSILNIDQGYNLVETIINSVAVAVGFTLALVLMAGMREKLELADIPVSFRGAGIVFITAGLLSLAFMGFIGIL
ncbi:MAG: electron transport complex subunit RsxA [Candidatus Muiribacterium halophilum]|uniref:Ion-translocating oxidoreductase complex subunit A n=1 Tax=Muiribacterium halophilum TaxID=2053465 RepID=A0A2N5ZHS1_MUIH1|nr:MAG: electron transport complex subunit RsxA [Candidatus Muirbacterium halophilum]